MNMNINSSDEGGSSCSNPTNKRNGNEGNVISGSFLSSWFGYFSGRDAATSTKSNDVNNNRNTSSSQLDRMEQMMIKMAEKCSSLENSLEAKCSSLETELRSVKDHVMRLENNVHSLHIHAQQNHEYNQMLLKNQGWKYSAHISTKNDWLSKGYTDDAADYLEDTATELKKMTVGMRRGLFPGCDTYYKGISLCPHVDAVETGSNDELLPHWDEFAAAIRQFAPAIKIVPDNFDSYFAMGNIVANQNTMAMIREALNGKPFTHMCFDHSVQVDFEVGGMNIDSIIRIAESNTSLRKLEIHCNRIGSDHVERICSIAHNHPLLELTLRNSINDDGVGNAILTSLLSSQELNLEKLNMERTRITSEVSMVLANFIATNQKLKHLDLDHNNLNDDDAVLIANALRNNTTLRNLYLNDNYFSSNVLEAFKSVMFDTSSLNAVATSNHSCRVYILGGSLYRLNRSKKIEDNRGSKIYSLLSDRHLQENLSNVQYFSDIDVKLLPDMLEAIQKYGNGGHSHCLNTSRTTDVKMKSRVYRSCMKSCENGKRSLTCTNRHDLRWSDHFICVTFSWFRLEGSNASNP